MKAASVIVAAIVAACSSDSGTGSSACGGGNPSAVSVCDNFFAPAASTLGAGAGVTWTWQGGNQHNVTFEDGQGSSTTRTSGSHNRTFAAVGTFRYRCTIHSTGFGNAGQMVGSVVVQ